MDIASYFLFFASVACVTAARDYVPVLMWGPSVSDDFQYPISGLSKLDTDEFYSYLLKRVKEDRPNIVLFVEENLSLEDFSWKDVNDQGAFPLLSNMSKSSDDLAFFPSVRNPYKAVKKLLNQGYAWDKYGKGTVQDGDASIINVKLSEPDSLESRPDLLRSHDSEITKVFNKLQTYTSNIIGIYTGNHSSWIDADVKYSRVKRNEPEEYITMEESGGSDPLILVDNNKTVLLAIRRPIVLTDGPDTFNLSDTASNPTVQKIKGNIALDVNFKYKEVQRPEIDFYFNGSDKSDWILSHLTVNEKRDQILVPSVPIGAPMGYSYHCSKSVLFTDNENQVTIAINNFQVQPWVKDGKFGPAIDCVPYFSIAIWSGLFIVCILTIVLAWAIVMIMDINTMDRFDDAKGKTITIAAAD